MDNRAARRTAAVALGTAILMVVGSGCTASRADTLLPADGGGLLPVDGGGPLPAEGNGPGAGAGAAGAQPPDETPDAAPDTIPPLTTSPAPSTTAAPTSTTTTIPMPAGIHDPSCAWVVQPGESLSVIAEGIDDPTVTAESLRAENSVADVDLVFAGAVIDICPGDHIDALTGEQRLAATAESSSGVAAQQRKINELFAGSGLPPLAVDGVSGAFTRQQLCAARLALGLPVSRDDMESGSDEERLLMEATSISIPAGAPTDASRWVLIDETCQIMFAGEGADRVRFVFKTSTGEPGWGTRTSSWMRAFRYNPALDNDGWHNSTKFPVEDDNPLNGNMYKPIYFHRGQAIHGANNVPPEPASKGCARLRPGDQDALVAWLGLDGVTSQIHSERQVGLVVAVQGRYEAAS